MKINEKFMKDPLQDLVKSADYIKGMQEAKRAADERLSKILEKFYIFTEQIHDSIAIARAAETDYNLRYAIYNGRTMLRKMFMTKNEAWDEIYRMCGDKIDPAKSNFVVKQIFKHKVKSK